MFPFFNFFFLFHMWKGWDILVCNSYSYHTLSHLALNQTWKWTGYKNFIFFCVISMLRLFADSLCSPNNICIDFHSNWETKNFCLVCFHCICSLQPRVSSSSMFPLCLQMSCGIYLPNCIILVISYIWTIAASWVRKLTVMPKVLFLKKCPKIKSQLSVTFY